MRLHELALALIAALRSLGAALYAKPRQTVPATITLRQSGTQAFSPPCELRGGNGRFKNNDSVAHRVVLTTQHARLLAQARPASLVVRQRNQYHCQLTPA